MGGVQEKAIHVRLCLLSVSCSVSVFRPIHWARWSEVASKLRWRFFPPRSLARSRRGLISLGRRSTCGVVVASCGQASCSRSAGQKSKFRVIYIYIFQGQTVLLSRLTLDSGHDHFFLSLSLSLSLSLAAGIRSTRRGSMRGMRCTAKARRASRGPICVQPKRVPAVAGRQSERQPPRQRPGDIQVTSR
jgi:hypothetical protein